MQQLNLVQDHNPLTTHRPLGNVDDVHKSSWTNSSMKPIQHVSGGDEENTLAKGDRSDCSLLFKKTTFWVDFASVHLLPLQLVVLLLLLKRRLDTLIDSLCCCNWIVASGVFILVSTNKCKLLSS